MSLLALYIKSWFCHKILLHDCSSPERPDTSDSESSTIMFKVIHTVGAGYTRQCLRMSHIRKCTYVSTIVRAVRAICHISSKFDYLYQINVWKLSKADCESSNRKKLCLVMRILNSKHEQITLKYICDIIFWL
jgi:hypothetical protein